MGLLELGIFLVVCVILVLRLFVVLSVVLNVWIMLLSRVRLHNLLFLGHNHFFSVILLLALSTLVNVLCSSNLLSASGLSRGTVLSLLRGAWRARNVALVLVNSSRSVAVATISIIYSWHSSLICSSGSSFVCSISSRARRFSGLELLTRDSLWSSKVGWASLWPDDLRSINTKSTLEFGCIRGKTHGRLWLPNSSHKLRGHASFSHELLLELHLSSSRHSFNNLVNTLDLTDLLFLHIDLIGLIDLRREG